MKKLGVIAAALSMVLVPLFVFVGVANAQSFRTGDNVTVAAGETVDSSVWASGRNIDVAGTVNGDLWCAGMNITITGTVRGDVMCAGQTIRIDGTVEGDVRVAAQTVSVGEDISGSLSSASQSFSLAGDASVGRDASVAGTDITINGNIGRDLAVAAENVTVTGTVERDVRGALDKLRVEDEATIGGDLAYTSAREANISNEAQIAGETTRTEPTKSDRVEVKYLLGFNLVMALFIILSLLLLSLILLVLFPGIFRGVTDTALASPLKVLVVGFLAGLVFPVVFMTLLISLVGIPLAFLLLLAWLLVLMLAGPFFAYYLGRLIMKDRQHPAIIMTVGALLVLFVYFIPFIGFLVFLVVLWMGSGMLLVSLYNYKWRHGTPVAEAAAPERRASKPKKS